GARDFPAGVPRSGRRPSSSESPSGGIRDFSEVLRQRSFPPRLRASPAGDSPTAPPAESRRLDENRRRALRNEPAGSGTLPSLLDAGGTLAGNSPADREGTIGRYILRSTPAAPRAGLPAEDRGSSARSRTAGQASGIAASAGHRARRSGER